MRLNCIFYELYKIGLLYMNLKINYIRDVVKMPTSEHKNFLFCTILKRSWHLCWVKLFDQETFQPIRRLLDEMCEPLLRPAEINDHWNQYGQTAVTTDKS